MTPEEQACWDNLAAEILRLRKIIDGAAETGEIYERRLSDCEADNERLTARLAEEVKNKKEFERDWLAACDELCNTRSRLAEAEAERNDALAASMRDMKRLQEAEALLRAEQQWLRETFGERCSDYEPDCCGCQAWKQIDRIDAFLAPDSA